MSLDRDRFAKCQALADRGATPGERAAGRAAAARVAASAGMTLEEAMRLVGAASRPSSRPPPPPPRSSPTYQPDAAYAHAWRKAKAKPKPKPEPVTVAEILAQKAADLERRKKALAREERKQEELRQEIEKLFAKTRAEQNAKDREWTAARARHQQDR